MITLKEFMEVVDYRITEGSDFTWNCFGEKPYSLSAWNGDHNGWSCNITFDTQTQEVYMVEVCDYKRSRAYRLINPIWKDRYDRYADIENPEYRDQAWDDVDFTDLETVDDWIQKAQAITEGKDYDTRISVPVEFSDEELLRYMKLAHERDITFNQFVEEALKEAIRQVKENSEDVRRRQEILNGKKEIEPHGY